MRNITGWEAGKFGVEYDFESPEFLAYGDEAGWDYDRLVEAQRVAIAYDTTLAEHLQCLVIDIYYDNLEWLVTEGRDYYEQIILPSYIQTQDKYQPLPCAP